MTSTDVALEAFEMQAGFCEQLGSPFTARLLRALAVNISAGGVVADLIRSFEEEPVAAALALRLAGAFHRRALDEPGGVLAQIYPTCGGDGGASRSDEALLSVLVDDVVAHRAHYQDYLESAPQTNEVGRSSVLIGGYLTIAALTGLPLDVCEIGASAGLNLGFDHFHYELAGMKFGDANSPVQLSPDWHGKTPPVSAALKVRSRQACDIAPLDLGRADTQARLESYIWGDQLERMARLRGAISLARMLNIKVQKESADQFIVHALTERKPGAAFVIAHTIMWQYMSEEMRHDIEQTIQAAGAVATADAPLAWLRLEPRDPIDPPHLQLTLWPGGESRDLAMAHPHGASVRWL